MAQKIRALRESIDFAKELCNFIRNEQTTRYMSTKIHVSDVLNCHAKLYLDRAYDPAQACYALIRMYKGKLLEDAVVRKFIEAGYYHENEYGGILATPAAVPGTVVINVVDFNDTLLTLPAFHFVATPDFVYHRGRSLTGIVETVIELKTTAWPEKVTNSIAHAQAQFMRELGSPWNRVPFPPKGSPVFFNWLLQLAAYYEAARRVDLRRKAPALVPAKDVDTEWEKTMKLLAVYAGSQREYTFPPAKAKGITHPVLGRYYEMFKERVAGAAYAVLKGSTTPFNKEVFRHIYDHELCSWGLLVAGLGCPSCPYRTQKICPTLPPIRTPDEERGDFDRLNQLIDIHPLTAGDGRRKRPLTRLKDDIKLLHETDKGEVAEKLRKGGVTFDAPGLAGASQRREEYIKWLKDTLLPLICTPVVPWPKAEIAWLGLFMLKEEI